MNVRTLAGMPAKTNPNILGSFKIQIHHLVPPRLAARAVLRYWRFRRRFSSLAATLAAKVLPAPVAALSHTLVLSLGFLLVVPALGIRPSTVISVAVAPATSHFVTPLYPPNALDAEDMSRPPIHHAAASPATPVAIAVRAPASPSVSTLFKPPPGSGGDGLSAIYAVFNGSPGLTWALRVANCESHYNPLAVNRYSGASGLFQFMPSTWNAHFAGWNIWDPYAQARAALVFYNNGWTNAWTCK